MRILLLTHSFNSLAQRLYADLRACGHTVSVELDIGDGVTQEAVALFAPDVLIAPFLKRAIAPSVYERVPCLIVHPGIAGDRGPSALDWAIERGESTWGVTVLQATGEFDAGPVWAERTFAMRAAAKSSLYRFEVTEAAVAAVADALARIPPARDRDAPRAPGAGPAPVPAVLWPGARGTPHPPMRQAQRAIDWMQDDTELIVRRIRAADGFPGVLDRLLDVPCCLFDAHAEPDPALYAAAAVPGTALARRNESVLVKTRDGAVWIGQVQRADGVPDDFKLPVLQAIPAASALPLVAEERRTAADEIDYQEADGVGWLSFDFYNGAASTAQCERLAGALAHACARPTRVLMLAGGADFFCNGIHLNVIEAADSPAEESWRNILAMDDVARAILECDDRMTVSLLRGNAAAGGVFLALAADLVWARAGAVLNPHYKNMGNLYGSEYWTYSLPRRVGAQGVDAVLGNRLPMLAESALHCGLIDGIVDVPSGSADALRECAREKARRLAAAPDWAERVRAKRRRREEEERRQPLAQYRARELEQMRRNFFGFDPSYHVARSHFVRKTPQSWTPRHLAVHRVGAPPAAAPFAPSPAASRGREDPVPEMLAGPLRDSD
jgi:putative two-component system hydrogenase maturation factor HypX/HoxX